MINLDDCQLLGSLTKPHGVHGKLKLRLNNLSPENILKMEWVFLLIDGLPVPFFVSEYQVQNEDSLIIGFKDIEAEESARKLVDLEMYIQKENIAISESIESDFTLLLGYAVKDINHGIIGVLKDILDFELNPILLIVNDSGEILLPLQPEFIQNIDENDRLILVETPEGLVDIIQ